MRVDVIVTDKKGAPVDTLKQADFQVFEDGKPQDIETFKLFKIDAITSTTPARPIRTSFDEESEAQRDDVRLFAFFLDDYHVRRGNAMFARGKMAAFVRDQVAPQDMVSIMYPLQPTDTVVMSRDHENLAKALEQFDGVKYNYTPRNQFEDQYANYPATVVEQIRNDVSISAIKGLIIKLGGLREGRKALVLVSEGYTDYLPPQMRRQNAMMGGTEVTANPFAGDGMAAEKERFFSQAEMLGRLRDIYELANRNNVSIYALDPRGLAAFDSDIDEGAGGISLTTDRDMLRLTMDSIRVLADNTDGRAIVNSNDLLAGLKQIVRDQSAYYLLGYNSARSLGDGKFHEIKVKVNRPGVEVRARKGYVAFSQEDLKNAMAPPKPDRPKDVDSALASITSQRRGEYIRSWMGMSRGNNGKTKITYVWEPAPAVGERREQADRVAVTVIGTDGAPFYRGRSPSAAGQLLDRHGPGRRCCAGAAACDRLAPRARGELRGAAGARADEGRRRGREQLHARHRCARVHGAGPVGAGSVAQHPGRLPRPHAAGGRCALEEPRRGPDNRARVPPHRASAHALPGVWPGDGDSGRGRARPQPDRRPDREPARAEPADHDHGQRAAAAVEPGAWRVSDRAARARAGRRGEAVDRLPRHELRDGRD